MYCFRPPFSNGFHGDSGIASVVPGFLTATMDFFHERDNGQFHLIRFLQKQSLDISNENTDAVLEVDASDGVRYRVRDFHRIGRFSV